jgi:phage baseplate assembly protein W
MGNLRINTLTPKTVNNSGFTYSDLKLDLTFDYTVNNELLKDKEIKDSVNSLDYDALKNSIVNLFTTIPGQKLLNPFFGLNLAKYLFEPVNEDVATTIANDITQGIATFEPRLKIRRLNVGFSVDKQQYVISLNLNIPQINNKSFQLVGTLSNSGFFLNN